MDLRAALLAAGLGVGALAGCLKVPDEFPDETDKLAAPPSTVGEVLDRHVLAIGGAEGLRALKQRTVEARMVVHPEEGCEEDDETCLSKEETGSFFFQTTADGRMYRRNVVLGQVEERGFDGKLGWVLVGGALRIDTPEEAQVNREEAYLHWYFDVAERGVETTLLPPRKEDADGNIVILDGVNWRAPGAEVPKQVWFDRESGLRREEGSSEGEGAERTSQTIAYDDYRDVDGIKVPFSIKVTNQLGERQQVVEFVVSKVAHDKIDPAKFAIPDLPTPKAKPDTLLAQLEAMRATAAKDPKDASAQIEHARLAFQAGHFAESDKACSATLAADPKEPEALVLSARIAVLRGHYTEALKRIKRAARASVRAEILARERGWVYHRRHQYAQLAKELDSAGNPVLAGRYRSFAGTPLEPVMEGCKVEAPMIVNAPLAIVEIEVAGKKTGAIVDTGAADVIFTDDFARETAVNIRARSRLAEGMPEIGHGQVDTLTLGNLTLKNVPVNVFDNASIKDMAGADADKVGAVLGVGSLTDFAIAIDVPAAKLELVRRDKKCAADRKAFATGPSVPFVLHETHYVYVRAEMNGAEGIYLLNTGMRGADLTANTLAYEHAGIGAPALRADEAPMAAVDTLAVGDVTLKGLSAAWGYFQQTQTSDGFRLDGMLGLGALGKKRFVLDFESHQLHFPKG